MRFESVAAHAFGPFQGATLEFAPGMNVIYGPNESGKSTWHAALFAGLCGIRRGRPGREDRDFTERHRPWNGSTWEVSAVVVLEDGRRIELRHNLDAREQCQAFDTALARDCSDEIMNDGVPDGSRWLGLDRRSFSAIACVRQAQILEVLDDASMLQQHLQRAAATSGTDSTAAQAITLIEDFHRDNIGDGRVNSVKPLRNAIRQRDAADEGLQRAQDEHGKHLELAAGAEELEQTLVAAELELRLVRAKQAASEAEALEDGLRQAKKLRTTPLPQVDPEIEQRVGRSKRRVELTGVQQRGRGLFVAAAVAAVAAIAAVASGLVLPGLVLLVVAGALVTWALVQRSDAGKVRAHEELRAGEQALSEHRQAIAKRAADRDEEINRLLRGKTLEEFGAEVSTQRQAAERMADGLDPQAIEAVDLQPAPDAQLERLEMTARNAAAERDGVRGQVEERKRNLSSVADAEEALAAAETELERVQRLDRILKRTREFLEAAEESVHRTIAPVLAQSVRRWLPEVTSHRYAEVSVAPESLDVQVRSEHGPWRRAALLSHGTAEQVYLLLRVAMAGHLVPSGEMCPLILDDVTVQCDSDRKEAILRALHTVSRERQVILFSQEPEVLAWAESTLHEPDDQTGQLDPGAIGA